MIAALKAWQQQEWGIESNKEFEVEALTIAFSPHRIEIGGRTGSNVNGGFTSAPEQQGARLGLPNCVPAHHQQTVL